MAKSQRWSDWQSKSWATATSRWRLMPSQQILLMLLEGDKVSCVFSELSTQLQQHQFVANRPSKIR
ncbi:GM10856 [Drosophila sechellia]|uniref:GM10856 n=1 Tax=Drosophila sechellia TaxID=7238 RepID=B4I4B5_DROSE|nr:GM10856 [Drosophila sechellia]